MLPPDGLGVVDACRRGISEASAFSDFREYMEVAIEKLSEYNLGFLLMLDEFDKLQEGIDSGVTSPQVPENIRFLVQTYPRFSAILTGSQTSEAVGRRILVCTLRTWSALWSDLLASGTSPTSCN